MQNFILHLSITNTLLVGPSLVFTCNRELSARFIICIVTNVGKPSPPMRYCQVYSTGQIICRLIRALVAIQVWAIIVAHNMLDIIGVHGNIYSVLAIKAGIT